jgi:hypothetical protein
LSSGRSVSEGRIFLDHSLQKRQKECDGLSGTGLGLSDDISTLESGLNSLGLNRCHGIVLHVIEDDSK